MYTIALDPGNDAGFAIFSADKRLMFATVADFKDRERMPRKGGYSVCGALGLIPHRTPVQIVYERPVVRRPGDSPASPESIVTLSITLGKWLGYIETRLEAYPLQLFPFTPEAWKRNIPKEVCEHRARSILDPREVELADGDLGRLAPSIRHNGWDAIALGLVGLNRAKPGVLRRTP